MSPYLSAFSNARDTPLVSSPRSALPTTPGGGLASIDLGGQWTGMRPPSRTVSRHNSLQGINISGSQSTSPQSDGISASARLGKSSSSEKLSGSSDKTMQVIRAMQSPRRRQRPAAGADRRRLPRLRLLRHRRQRLQQHSDHISTIDVASSAVVPAFGLFERRRRRPRRHPTSRRVHWHAAASTRPVASLKNESQQYFDGGALTPGPEAFLLRLQGGAQELRAGSMEVKSPFSTAHDGIQLGRAGQLAVFHAQLGPFDVLEPQRWRRRCGRRQQRHAGCPDERARLAHESQHPAPAQCARHHTAGSGAVDLTNTSDYLTRRASLPHRRRRWTWRRD